jgi:2-polyprenyl-3-methyl-5-hydroxy-6-metoxy-1,4-benzoquinol methylase
MVLEKVDYTSLNSEYSDPTSLSYKKIRFVNTYIPNGGSYLDVGMGTGELLSKRVGKHQKIVGMDNDETSLMICQKKFADNYDITLVDAGIGDLKNRFQEKFDCITCLDILEHIEEKELIPSLQNIYNLLNENGIFIFSGPGIFEKIRIFFGRSPTHLHSHSPQGWKKYIETVGFKIVEVQSVDYPFIHSEYLRKKLPLFGMCCVIVAQKN